MKTKLNLGTQTGSLINHIVSDMNNSVPAIGMGATILCWTDRRAATVVEVSKDGNLIAVVEDIATRTDKNGMSDCQTYSYAPDPNGSKQYFRLRKNGSYVRKGEPLKGGQRVMIGKRDHHFDFSF